MLSSITSALPKSPKATNPLPAATALAMVVRAAGVKAPPRFQKSSDMTTISFSENAAAQSASEKPVNVVTVLP